MRNKISHSAEVRLTLEVAGLVLDVAQIGPNCLIVRDEHEPLPAGTAATRVIQVDQHIERVPVVLPDGAVVGQGWVRFLDSDPYPDKVHRAEADWTKPRKHDPRKKGKQNGQ